MTLQELNEVAEKSGVHPKDIHITIAEDWVNPCIPASVESIGYNKETQRVEIILW